jgi:hypothetical protein
VRAVGGLSGGGGVGGDELEDGEVACGVNGGEGEAGGGGEGGQLGYGALLAAM